jgi:hypothetical protein
MPRNLLDAREDLAKEGPCQVAFGELQGEVPGMSDQPPAELIDTSIGALPRCLPLRRGF